MKTEFEFHLTLPVTFKPNNSGEQQEAHRLILKAPTNKQRTQRILLKEYTRMAIFSFRNENENFDQDNIDNIDTTDMQSMLNMDNKTDEEIEEAGKMFVELLYACKDVKMTAVIEEFLLLLLQVCMVEDERPMTKPIFDKMSPGDTDRLLGAYLGNFIIGL